MRRFTLPLLFLLIIVAAAAQAPKSGAKVPSPTPAVPPIQAERIRTHVKFLAHDLLEGRGTGQRGGDIAGQYIASLFAIYGLEPAGDSGTFLQKVPMVGIATQPESTLQLTSGGQPLGGLKLGDDFVVMDETQAASSEVQSDLVFVGYGIVAPEYNWNDYQGADVKGKIVVVLVNEPPSTREDLFKGPALTYYGRWTYKYEEAARQGAAGCLIVHETSMASYGWDVVRNSWGGERSYLRSSDPQLKAAGWIQLEVARKLLGGAGQPLDALMKAAAQPGFKPLTLKAQARVSVRSKIREFESSNVVGKLTGSDAKLKDQAVVFSSHYDHLGIREGAPGDNIYNGASDNATGTAMLLEMAHAASHMARRPRRTLLFAAVTAEEQGLRGSEFLGQNSPIPVSQVSLGLNVDNVQPWGEPEELEAVGSERTTFYPALQNLAWQFGFAIKPDARPGAGRFYRSDHFSFARVGIPAFSVNAGAKYKGHPAAWGTEKGKEYNEQRYHQPSDEYKPEMDFSGNVKLARFMLALGMQAANQPELVQWRSGDEFEAARKRSQGGATGAQR